MNLESTIHELAKAAHLAARRLARTPAQKFDDALEAIAAELEARKAHIQAENELDLKAGEAKGISKPLLQRLRITDRVFADMVEGVRQVKALPSPLGIDIKGWIRPNGLHMRKVRVPIGVIGIIYESRPNVTIDAAVLCLKAGNAVILRGGSEAYHSNTALAEALQAGLEKAGLPAASAQLVPTTAREAIPILCKQSGLIDVMIPRGGHGLIKTVTEEARMPVIKHFHGVCMVYVHAAANPDMAESIVLNAKVQKPGVCNAMETLLVDERIAPTFIPRILKALHTKGVEIRGDAKTRALAGPDIEVKAATEEDWSREFLDLIIAVKVVAHIDEAENHMEHYGSHHSDAIITEDAEAARRFFTQVDSATVYWNASTRFTDGFEFGFGAEIGISTDKLHARGPMGLEELTSYKYLIEGNGQIRT